MIWSNLYSTELKYNLTFSTSLLAKKARWITIGLIVSCFAFTSQYILPHLALPHLSFASMVLTLSLWRIIPPFNHPFGGLKQVLLTYDGMLITGANQQAQITNKSRMYPWGCVLVLKEEGEVTTNQTILDTLHKEQSKRVFPYSLHQLVFKDSLSGNDYRRLARLVNRAGPADHG